MEFAEEEVKTYGLIYEDVNRCGYVFPCDKQGNILWEKISSPTAAKKNLAYCEEHQEKWNGRNGEVVTFISRSHYGICPFCGSKVYFDGSGYFGAFKCDCGKWYNRFGQELKPPTDPLGWFEDCDEDWDDDCYDDCYDYCDEDEDWESELIWYDNLYKKGL